MVLADDIPVVPNAIPDSRVLNNYKHPANVEFPNIGKESVQLLINAPRAFRVEDVRTAPDSCSPDAIRSPLSWSLHGPSFTDLSFTTNVSAHFVSAYYDLLPVEQAGAYETRLLPNDSEIYGCKVDDSDLLSEKICVNKGISMNDRSFTDLSFTTNVLAHFVSAYYDLLYSLSKQVRMRLDFSPMAVKFMAVRLMILIFFWKKSVSIKVYL